MAVNRAVICLPTTVWTAAIVASFTACTPGPIDIASSSLLDGLVAHWALDDGAGASALDSSGNSYDGVATLGTGSWIPGRFGGALRFGVGAEVKVDNFLQATEGWSVALWVRPTDADIGPRFVTLMSTEIPQTVVGGTMIPGGGWQMNMTTALTGQAAYQFGYWLGPDAGNYHLFNCNCVDADLTRWTHLGAVIDGARGTLSFYVDGSFRGLGNYSGAGPGYPVRPIQPGRPTLYLGRWLPPATDGDVRPFHGDLDDVVVYRRVLTAAEVNTLAHAAAPARR